MKFLEEDQKFKQDLNININSSDNETYDNEAQQDKSSSSSDSQNISGMDFLLFLILILLVLGNSRTFSAYFQIFDREINKVNNILNAFKSTADGLKETFSTSNDFEI